MEFVPRLVLFLGVAIDYRRDEVNANTMLAVLEGNKESVKSLGTGKVIDSGPNDEVFVFYSDHGSPGVLGMPSGGMLYADQLLGTIRRKRAAGGYKEMCPDRVAPMGNNMLLGWGSAPGIRSAMSEWSTWETFAPVSMHQQPPHNLAEQECQHAIAVLSIFSNWSYRQSTRPPAVWLGAEEWWWLHLCALHNPFDLFVSLAQNPFSVPRLSPYPASQMSMYIEACESGSLFQGMLEVRVALVAQLKPLSLWQPPKNLSYEAAEILFPPATP
eukprot:1158381-Pelagomonas_calceolata.AAC.2